MKKNIYYIANKNIKRFDTTWKFQYDVSTITDDTILFNGKSGADGETKTWYFNAPGGIIPGTVRYTYSDGEIGLTHETFQDITRTPNPNAPQLEYDAGAEAYWDSEHPSNKTRFLSPDAADIYPIAVVGTHENVIIDTEAPKIDKDRSQYVVLGNSKRKFRYYFHEETGLDYKNFSIKLGDEYIYKCERKTGQITWNDTVLVNVSIKADGLRNYLLEFVIDSLVCTTDDLNEKGLTIEVWDVAGNNSIYKVTKEFTDLEPGDLKPVEINFYDPDPADRVIKSNSVGEVWVDIYNPNTILWEYFPVAFKLNELSIGAVDESTIDDSTYEEDGHIRFKVKDIHDKGNVIVDGWVEIEDDEWQKTVKSVTYTEAEDGPWIVMDARNRLYNFNPYVPSVIEDSTFGKFIKFTETFLNTYYTGLSGETNISALEKTARILDFNDIHQVEKEYLYKFSEEHGNEINVSFNDIMDLDANLINHTSGFENNTYEDAVDVYRYMLEHLPYYNEFKGSETGVHMMLRLLGLCITITNLWLRTENNIEENPVFFDEEQIFEAEDYFMSSYFDVNIPADVQFRTFNDNVGILINIIKSIKPITRALETIKYTIKKYHHEHLYTNLRMTETSMPITYTCDFTDTGDGYYKKYGKNDLQLRNVSALYFPFDCKCTTSNNVSMTNVSGILSKLALKNNRDLTIWTVNNNIETSCTIPFGSFSIRKLDTGIIIENIAGEFGTKIFETYKKKYRLKIKYLKGTDNIFTL